MIHTLAHMEDTLTIEFTEENLPLGDLRYPDFQEARNPTHDHLRQARIKKDMAVFKPHLLQRFVISERPDGSKMMLDGGGRAWGMREIHHFSGSYPVPCQVFRDLNLQQELEMWYELNFNRSNTTALQGFLGRMKAGEDPEVTIGKITASFGMKIKATGDAGTVRCPLTLLKAHEAGVLETVYGVAVAAYGPLGGAAHATILNPLTNLLVRNRDKEVYPDRLVRVLREYGSSTNLVANAGKNVARHTKASVERLIAERYNHAAKGEPILKKNRLSMPKEAVRKVG